MTYKFFYKKLTYFKSISTGENQRNKTWKQERLNEQLFNLVESYESKSCSFSFLNNISHKIYF